MKYAANGWASLLGASVAGVVIVMQATGNPTAKLANTVALSGFPATAIGISWVLIRSEKAGEQRPAGTHMARACACKVHA